ncbi:MAG: YibE/F family protein [Thermoleophilia bacterium]
MANALLVVLGVLAVVTIAGLVALWPEGEDIERPPGFGQLATESATVTAVDAEGCLTVTSAEPGTGPGSPECRRVTVRLDSGADRGESTAFDLRGQIDVGVGDKVRVADSMLPDDATVGGVPADRYNFSDFERRSSLLWLTLAFAALVIITSRWQGLRALIGLGFSLGIVVLFVVPGILEGHEPVAVATVGALAIMLITIPLAHGLGPKSVAAALGTSVALGITLGLAEFATDVAHITGFGSEEASILSATTDTSIQGLLLAGIVIGALGVLDDLTVTQASTVMALRRADPHLGGRRLFSEGLSVGHDHIAATVNTLVLAYAGASLPVLLIFSVGGTSFGDALNSEFVAAEIVATLVGSIGLIAAVPITTALAVVLATHVGQDRLGEAHSHAH